MSRKVPGTIAAGLVAAAAAALLATGAHALPLPGEVAGADATTAPHVELAHGCHRGVLRDSSGWHFHTRACRRVRTAPPGWYDAPAYRRFFRTPLCSYQCRFIGPVKTCQQVCR